jgi:hypothetical protein
MKQEIRNYNKHLEAKTAIYKLEELLLKLEVEMESKEDE